MNPLVQVMYGGASQNLIIRQRIFGTLLGHSGNLLTQWPLIQTFHPLPRTEDGQTLLEGCSMVDSLYSHPEAPANAMPAPNIERV